MRDDLKNNLDKLEQLIDRERLYARNLQVHELQELQEQKADLIRVISIEEGNYPEEFKPQLTRLSDANIRNARLIHSSLELLRQTVSNCAKSLATPSYSHLGQQVRSVNSGILLAGKV